MVQWLRLNFHCRGRVSSIPGQGTKIPHALHCGQNLKKKKICLASQILFPLLKNKNVSHYLVKNWWTIFEAFSIQWIINKCYSSLLPTPELFNLSDVTLVTLGEGWAEVEAEGNEEGSLQCSGRTVCSKHKGPEREAGSEDSVAE